jgi:hypothetical protein
VKYCPAKAGLTLPRSMSGSHVRAVSLPLRATSHTSLLRAQP